MDASFFLFPRRWTQEPERPEEWEEEEAAKKAAKPLPAAGSIIVSAAAGSVIVNPPNWEWHTDEESAIERVRLRVLIIIVLDLMVCFFLLLARLRVWIALRPCIVAATTK